MKWNLKAKRDTVVRQNRCDREMNFFVLLCFFLYMAMQLLSSAGSQINLATKVNLILYFIFVPGFILIEGYSFARMAGMNEDEIVKRYLLKRALRWYICYFVLAMLQDAVCTDLPLSASFVDIVTASRIPSISAVFFTMACMLLVVWAFYGKIRFLSGRWQCCIAAAVICLLVSFLRMGTESYAVTAVFVGSTESPLPPGIPYFAFFVMGIWCWNKKPGFQWKIGLAAAVVTLLSLAFYQTPLQNLCRVTVSCLPVYLIYVVSELLSDVTLRFGTVRLVCEMIESVFLVYTMVLLAAFHVFGDANSVCKTIVISVGIIGLIYFAVVCFAGLCRAYTSVMKVLSKNIKHKTAAYFIIYTIVFVFFLLIAFAVFLKDHHSMVVGGDGMTQYFPRAVYYIRYMKTLLSKLIQGTAEFPMYDFTIGFGNVVVYITEPLYLIFLLFGEEHAELAYNLTVLMRFYLSGISISILLLYFKKDYFTTFLASIVYVFCGFALFAGPMHVMFMIPMIMLPLLIVSIEEILQKRRWYLCTIFVALSLFSNYYFLYMNTIAMGIYFLVRFFCQKDKTQKTVKNFFARGLVISGSYLLGVGMSCFTLVTSFGMYVGSGRNGDVRIKTPSLFFYDSGWLVRCFLNFITTANSPGEWLKLGFLPIAMLAVIILFRRKKRTELKLFSVIALIFMAFPLFGFIFSGFSAVINRWCYMIALLAAYIVADCLEDLLQMSRQDKIACTIVIGLYGALVLFGADASGYTVTGHTKAGFFCLAITFVILLFCQQTNRKYTCRVKQCMLFVLTAVMVGWQAYAYYGIAGGASGYRSAGTVMEREYTTSLAAVSEIDDDSFYRSATPKLDYTTSNSSFLLGYNSITSVLSTQNSSIMEYFEKVGNIGYSMTQLLGLGNRTFLSALASVKYYTYFDNMMNQLPAGYEELLETEVNGNHVTVEENQYALPLGYTYDETISEEELEQYEVEERSEVMMQKAVLADSQQESSTETQLTGETLEIQSVDEKGITLAEHAMTAEEDSKKHELTIYFEGQPNSETYIVLKNAWLEGDMSEEGISLTFVSQDNQVKYTFQPDDYRYATGQQDFVFNLGYHEEAISACKIKMNRAGMIQFESFEVYSQSMENLEQYTSDLTEDILENVTFGTNVVSGTISLEQDKTLVLSIPYQKGWTAYVDGQETELQRANYMYMALPLSAGDHEIELRFEIPYIRQAVMVMAGSTVLFLLLLAGRVIRRKYRKEK